MKSPLILGTAEFHPDGYAGKPCPSYNEMNRIFSLAREAGIHLLDTAESYDCHNIIASCAEGFSIYNKTRDWKVHLDWGNNELRGLLYHYESEEPKIEFPHIHRWLNLGASVYRLRQLPDSDKVFIQVPFNIENKEFIDVFDVKRTVFVRSVFGRGGLLKEHSIKECLDYVDQFRPDGIIVGVNTAKELEQILKER
jgi:hypothetical protein